MNGISGVQTGYVNNVALTETEKPAKTITLQEENKEKKEEAVKIASIAAAALGIAAIAIGAAKGIKSSKANKAASELMVKGKKITGAKTLQGTFKKVVKTAPEVKKAALTTEEKIAKMGENAKKLAEHNKIMKAKQLAHGPVDKAAHEAKLAKDAIIAQERAFEAAAKVSSGEATVTQLKNQGITKNLSHKNKKIVKDALKDVQNEMKPPKTMSRKEANKLAKKAAKAERAKQYEAAQKEANYWHKTHFGDKSAEESASFFEEMFAKQEGRTAAQTAATVQQGAEKARAAVTDKRVLARMESYRYKSEAGLKKILNSPKSSNIDKEAAQALLDKMAK